MYYPTIKILSKSGYIKFDNGKTMSMKGKVALITGAGRGIGRATALAFAKRGATVAVSDKDREMSDQVCDEINCSGGKAISITANVAREEDVKKLIDAVLDNFGALDYAFNNAGILGATGVPLEKLDWDAWDNIVAVNLSGVMLSLKYELSAMRRRGGAIVNTSSIMGLVGAPYNPTYSATKHAVIGLTRSVAAAYAKHGVRVNAVCPGSVDTDMISTLRKKRDIGTDFIDTIPIGRMASASEIANCVVWLCSDEAAYVVGHALCVDGGYTAV